jgi:hypothetical protein
VAREGDPPEVQKVSLTAVELLSMSQDELGEFFRVSPAGPIPRGEGDGTAIFAPDTPVSDVAAKLTHLVAWKGKMFDAERGELRNEVGPTGVHAVRAKVYYGESWFDQKKQSFWTTAKPRLWRIGFEMRFA